MPSAIHNIYLGGSFQLVPLDPRAMKDKCFRPQNMGYNRCKPLEMEAVGFPWVNHPYKNNL